MFKLGRNRPKVRAKLRFSDYKVRGQLPTAPAVCDYSSQALKALGQMYDNDTLGDCFVAGIAHISGALVGAAGRGDLIIPDSEIISAYTAIGGYDPSQTQPDGSNPTDNGCDESTGITWMQNNTFDPEVAEWYNYLAIDATNQAEICSALYLFGPTLVFGLELPDDYVNPFPSKSGFLWDIAGDPDPNNGHCIVGVGYDTVGVIISTWAMLGKMTWAAIAKYLVESAGGQLTAILSPDIISTAQAVAPNGLNWTQLLADLQQGEQS